VLWLPPRAQAHISPVQQYLQRLAVPKCTCLRIQQFEKIIILDEHHEFTWLAPLYTGD
jgi:hypothetical protein